MYMSQHQFTPVPSKFDLWRPYNRNYMSLTARAPGAVLSRILRSEADPDQFFAVGLWTSHEAANEWSTSAESRLGAKPSADQGLYEGYPMAWSRWELVDFAFGLEGPGALAGPDLVVRHVTWSGVAEVFEPLETLTRAKMSLMARQPGFVCGETYRGHRGDRLLSICTFRGRQRWPFAGGEPAELDMLRQSDAAAAVRAKAPAPFIVDCEVFESVWGPDSDALQGFIAAAAA
jgi:heme-degrading monooxygenase HmoA